MPLKYTDLKNVYPNSTGFHSHESGMTSRPALPAATLDGASEESGIAVLYRRRPRPTLAVVYRRRPRPTLAVVYRRRPRPTGFDFHFAIL